MLGDVGPIVRAGKEDFSDRETLLKTLEALDGVDGLLFETCSTPSVLSAVEFALHRLGWLEDRPLLLSIAYRRDSAGGIRSHSGHAPEFFARHALRHGVAALGVNCGMGMRLAGVLRGFPALPWGEPTCRSSSRPSGGAVGRVRREVAAGWLAAGAGMIGGCCGTTAEHIQGVAGALGRKAPGAAAAWLANPGG